MNGCKFGKDVNKWTSFDNSNVLITVILPSKKSFIVLPVFENTCNPLNFFLKIQIYHSRQIKRKLYQESN